MEKRRTETEIEGFEVMAATKTKLKHGIGDTRDSAVSKPSQLPGFSNTEWRREMEKRRTGTENEEFEVTAATKTKLGHGIGATRDSAVFIYKPPQPPDFSNFLHHALPIYLSPIDIQHAFTTHIIFLKHPLPVTRDHHNAQFRFFWTKLE